ncbi:MFS transporter [Micromonospora zhanjiangensis]
MTAGTVTDGGGAAGGGGTRGVGRAGDRVGSSGGLGSAYWRLWSAAVISRLGDSVRTPALALLAAAVTGDPRLLAAVVIAGQLPPLVFGLIGGVYADRWDRRRTMAAVDGVRAVLVAVFAVLVATGQAGLPALVGCAFALAALGTLFDASAFAVLPAVVPADRLPVANGRLQAGAAVAGGFVGAPLAGVLFALAAALPFAVDAVSYGAAALLALTLRPPAPAGHVGGNADRASAAASTGPTAPAVSPERHGPPSPLHPGRAGRTGRVGGRCGGRPVTGCAGSAGTRCCCG